MTGGGREAEAVAHIFRDSDIHSSDVLVVHSAFSGLSRNGFRADAFIEELASRVPEGALMMPAMSWRIATDDHPFFDELETPSITGALSEVFRTRYATARSLHPTHSFAAMGPLAEAMTRDHHIETTPCSPAGPIGRMQDRNALILLIGCWFESCTLIHLAEECIDPEFYFRPPNDTVYQCRDRHRALHPVRIRRHKPLDRDFAKFAGPLRARGQLLEGAILGAAWGLFRAQDLSAVVFETLRRDPKGTLASI